MEQARLFTAIGVVINVCILALFKYTGFFITSFNQLFHISLGVPVISLPIGISYFTFTGIAYLVDVYHQNIIAEKSFFRFTNYLIMFPKILMGPITRYSQVEENLSDKWFVNERFGTGVQRFVAGLGKKVILADNLAIVSGRVFGADFNAMDAGVSWFGLISYALQIFFDFSGYTDMAIGIGLMLGFNLPENFDFPYFSRSVTEFWRRWHMTLTGWFRTYIFIPLDFKWRRMGFLRQPLVIMIVFLLTGLWHGAGWNFILWGGYFGLILSIEALGMGKWLKKIPAGFQYFYSLFVVWIGWIFFRITDVGQWGEFFKSLLGFNGNGGEVTLRSLNILLYIPLILLGILWSTPLMGKLQCFLAQKGIFGRVLVFGFYTAVFVLSIAYLLSNGYTSFLYSQF